MILSALLAALSLNLNANDKHRSHRHSDHSQNHNTTSKHVFKAVTVGPLTFENFEARASIGQNPNSASYGKVTIMSGSDTLIRAVSLGSTDIELHEHQNDNGIMRMRKVTDGFPVAADAPLTMKSGGYHMMLIGLIQPLEEGTTLDIDLTFSSGYEITLTIPVINSKMMHKH